MRYLALPRFMAPPGVLTFSSWRRLTRSLRVMEYSAMRPGSTTIWISRSTSPVMSTSSTPGVASILSSRSSANSVKTEVPTLPVKETSITGAPEVLTSLMIESSASSGRSDLAISTLSLTFCRASSMLTLGSNSIMMAETPSTLVEVVSLMPGMPVSCRSIGIVTSVSMSPGDTPG